MLHSTEPEKRSVREETPALPAWVPTPGTVIAEKYEVERVLGAGGMGVVVAARHRQLGHRVAIKFLRSEATQDGNAVERFLREARASVALSSEHATRVLDVGTLETGAPYMVMEYLDGVDLGEVLKQHRPLAVVDAVGAVLQACEAIAEAHTLGIIHRDLKPSNLFLARRMDGTPLVKVLDFGISKQLHFNRAEVSPGLTGSGLIMGSPGYMSPEQVRNAKAVDARTDIWALGVVLYELLTGTRPFGGDTPGEVFAQILSETPVPMSQLRSDLPSELAATVAQCLERSLERRIQSVAELAPRLLPFAPPGCEQSVARILGVSRVGSLKGSAASATLTAPRVANEPSFATEPAWQKSGHAPLAGLPRRRRPVVMGWIVAAAMTATIGTLVLVRARTRLVATTATAPTVAGSRPGEASPAAASARAVTPSGAPVSDGLTSPANEPSPRSVELAIVPQTASVEVDGLRVRPTGGHVELRGLLGSVHHVHVWLGKMETQEDAVIAETGAVPPAIQLRVTSTAPRTVPNKNGSVSAKATDSAPVSSAAAPSSAQEIPGGIDRDFR